LTTELVHKKYTITKTEQGHAAENKQYISSNNLLDVFATLLRSTLGHKHACF